VAPYTVHAATPQMKAWAQQMQDAGLELFVLSNNRGRRPQSFAEALGIPHVNRAWKPFTKKAEQVMKQRGYSPSETAFIGDQIFTDTACAKWCGACAVCVRPIEFHRFILRFRYWLEIPFRQYYHRKCRK